MAANLSCGHPYTSRCITETFHTVAVHSPIRDGEMTYERDASSILKKQKGYKNSTI